jgi:ribonuclease VapC
VRLYFRRASLRKDPDDGSQHPKQEGRSGGAPGGEDAGREFDLLVHKAGLDIVVMDSGQVELARSAWRRFGKGRHPAGLNIGDGCAYALASCTGEPLPCKGEDFRKTDVHPARES